MRARIAAMCFSLMTVACGGADGNNIGAATVESDPVNGVDASGAAFPFFGGAVSNGLDLDQDGQNDDSVAIFIALISDDPDFCNLLNESLLSGEDSDLEDIEDQNGTLVLLTATQRVLNSQSNLTLPTSFVGDGIDGQVEIAFTSVVDGVTQAVTSSDNLGSLNVTFNEDGTMNGDFSGALIFDTSGQADFDVDTDGDGVNDATTINAAISGTFENAQLCGGLEGIALLVSLFAGF